MQRQSFGEGADRLVYRAMGCLNEAGDNCILLPTYYAGNDESYNRVIGAGRALDPARYFIVIANMLGNGISASPSNCPNFQPASVTRNVELQHAMLQALGVRRIALVYGWSMGAMQGYEWAVRYPDMVGGLLAVCGSAACWPLNYLFLEGQRAAMQGGRAAFGRAYAGWAYSAAFYRECLYLPMGFADLAAFLKFWEDDHLTLDERDLLAMLWTWQNASLGLDDLRAITARTIIMPADTDMYFTLEEARLEAGAIKGAALRVLHSPYGHCAGAPGRFGAESALVEAAMRDLLAV